MKNSIFLYSALLCVFSSSAFAVEPTVRALKVPSKIVYEFVPDKQTNCDKSGSVHMVGAEKAAGCTTTGDFEQYVDVNCTNKTIVFGFGWKKFLVEVVDKYKKGTMSFDQIVKHELTHVRLHQKTAEKFYQPIGQALLMQYEKSEREGKVCSQIKDDIFSLFDRYVEKYVIEDKKQQKLIDGKENYAYQDEQVYKAKLFLTPRVKMSEKKTEYISGMYNFGGDFGHGYSFDVNGDVPVFTLILWPTVYYPSNSSKKSHQFKTGMKCVESRLAQKREIFREIAEDLKWFLPEAFKKASQTKSEYSDIKNTGLNAASQMISDRLKKAEGDTRNLSVDCKYSGRGKSAKNQKRERDKRTTKTKAIPFEQKKNQKAPVFDLKSQVVQERKNKGINLEDDWLNPEKIKAAQNKYDSEKRRIREEQQEQLYSDVLSGNLKMAFLDDVDLSANKKQQNGQEANQNVNIHSKHRTAYAEDENKQIIKAENAGRQTAEKEKEEQQEQQEKQEQLFSDALSGKLKMAFLDDVDLSANKKQKSETEEKQSFDDDIFNSERHISSGEDENNWKQLGRGNDFYETASKTKSADDGREVRKTPEAARSEKETKGVQEKTSEYDLKKIADSFSRYVKELNPGEKLDWLIQKINSFFDGVFEKISYKEEKGESGK